MQSDPRVEAHYSSPGIADRVLAALRAANGADAPVTVDALAPLDHFHGRGVAATRELADLLRPQAGEHILDMGSGLGGPARWFAVKFGCRVTGVDLTEEFCKAAEALNLAAGLADRVRIIHASALALPLPDAAFDRAYSQNVIMNIADKPGFYAEAFRVLRPGGVLALSNLCAGANGAPHYPVPWAQTAATSFLVSPEETRAQLTGAGFAILSFRDTSADNVAFEARQRPQPETEPLPPLGVHVALGERMREFRANSRRSLEEGRLATVEALCRKPG
jgi:ubiquinone/menaquinone biosynthesis C-methylase UbiE